MFPMKTLKRISRTKIIVGARKHMPPTDTRLHMYNILGQIYSLLTFGYQFRIPFIL